MLERICVGECTFDRYKTEYAEHATIDWIRRQLDSNKRKKRMYKNYKRKNWQASKSSCLWRQWLGTGIMTKFEALQDKADHMADEADTIENEINITIRMMESEIKYWIKEGEGVQDLIKKQNQYLLQLDDLKSELKYYQKLYDYFQAQADEAFIKGA